MIMSIYDVEDIARWKEENMSCMFCTEYKGIGEPCNRGITVQNLSESFNCEYYKYNGELNGEK